MAHRLMGTVDAIGEQICNFPSDSADVPDDDKKQMYYSY